MVNAIYQVSSDLVLDFFKPYTTKPMRLRFLMLMSLLAFSQAFQAQISARLFQYPDVSDTQIAFTYGGGYLDSE